MRDYEREKDALFALKWPTFSDASHPLKPDEAEGRHPPKVVLAIISNRLQELYHEAKVRDGITFQQWADACGCNRQTPAGWLRHPEAMKERHVAATCELFGVSVEYLRAETDWRGSTASVWDAEEVARTYETLNRNQKETVTRVLQSCLLNQVAARMLDESARDIERIYDESVKET